MTAERPITLMVAALGGEGGGVLTDWIVSAAREQNLAVQSTSIPGVAQRTGATTYYVEMMAVPAGGRRPVMALAPGVGDIDLMVASELLEAGRAVAAGFVTPERTLIIASTHRLYAMDEKIAMADGRLDSGRLMAAIRAMAQRAVLIDMAEVAHRSGAMINAVLLGAIAGCGRLPIAAEAFEAAIRRDGKAVEANLAGFRAGLHAVTQGLDDAGTPSPEDARAQPQGAALAGLEGEIRDIVPAAAEVVRQGVRRLAAYQDQNYARLYLTRLAAIGEADRRAGAGGVVLRETARHLALRMSYEDVIRVAAAKIDPARFARIVADMRLAAGEPFAVVEFLKPGIEELCSILPWRLAEPVLRLAERRGWLARVHWAMEIKTTSVSGYLRLRLIASLRRYRPRTYRFRVEQAAIEAWLALVGEAAAHSAALALEVVECARLIKGYGDTHRRGTRSYELIVSGVIRPALSGALAPRLAADAVASARTAALADPEGERLADTLAAIGVQAIRREAAE